MGDRYDGPMSALPTHPSADAVAALVAVTTCEADPSRGDEAVAALAEAIRAAAAARLVIVWMHDPRDAAGRIVAAAGASHEELADLAVAIDGGHDIVEECDLRSSRVGSLAVAAAAIGAPLGLVVPVAPASRGLVVVAGDAPLLHEELRR